MNRKIRKTELQCQILWVSIDDPEWHDAFLSVKRSTLLQSPDYALCQSRLNHQRIRRGFIKINGVRAGIFQILEASLFGRAVHGVILDRGPLWFEGFGSENDFITFLDAFSSEFPKRIGRKVRIIPEFSNSPIVINTFKKYGFKCQSEPYETIWLDLGIDETKRRERLKKNWRGSLKKAGSQALEIEWSDEGKHFSWLINHYAQDKTDKGYNNISLKSVIALAKEFSRGENLIIGTALLDEQPIASILIFVHGRSATYQIGYSSKKGRDLCAHHLLLFKAQDFLKERQVYEFDLGGINSKDAKGVRQFKEGLGGEHVILAPLYTR